MWSIPRDIYSDEEDVDGIDTFRGFMIGENFYLNIYVIAQKNVYSIINFIGQLFRFNFQ